MARRRQGRVPTIEWIGGAIGVLIVVGTIGTLTWETIHEDANEIVLGVAVVGVRPQADVFAVDVEVRNAGGAAAADVHVLGIARSADGRTAEPEARVDYVPGESTRHVTLVFPFDPGARPAVRVSGYRQP